MNIASTTLGSKILHQYKEHFSKLAVDAVLKLKVNCMVTALVSSRHAVCCCPGVNQFGSYSDY